MSRLAVLLGLLLLAAPLPLLAGAQAPPGYQIPTEQYAVVGGLNVTAWIMRDTRTITYTPDLRQNPLGYLWNLNFTAGSLGIVYVKGTVVEPDDYVFDINVSSPNPLVQLLQQPSNQSITAQSGACSTEWPAARCALGGNRTSADATFQFFIAGSAPAGPLPLEVGVRTSQNTTGGPVSQAERTFRYTLQVLDPLPPFAQRAEVGTTTLGAWTNGGPLGSAAGGCLGGSAVGRDENVSQGAPAIICLLAVTRSDALLRVSGRLTGPEWFVAPDEAWTSEPFNASSGGPSAPVHGFVFQTNGLAPLGGARATLHYTLERQSAQGWQAAGNGSLEVPFTVTALTLVQRPGATGLNWIAHAPLLLASVAGLGYMAYTNRSPKLQPRSQALKAEEVRRKTKDDDAATAVVAEQQRQEVQEQAWQKKLQILEAKREDILKSIQVAEERHQRGEITEHVLKGIRERKERQLEQVAKEMEEVRG